MKLHLSDLWRHTHHTPTTSTEPSHWQDAKYAAVLVLGVPTVLVVTMYMVRYGYDGLMWLMSLMSH